MSRWRSLATLCLSAAVHAVAVLAALLLVSPETLVPALVVELTDAAVVRDGPTAASGPTTASGAGASDAPRERRVAAAGRAAPDSRREREVGASSRPVINSGPEAETAVPSRSLAARDSGGKTGDRPPGEAASPPSPASPVAVGLQADFEELARDASVSETGRGAGDGPDSGVANGLPRPGPQARGGAGGPGGRLALAAPGGWPADPGAEYTAYLASLRRRIQESLGYPELARRRGLHGTVHLEIVIRADGAIGAVSVVGSSSHALLDDAAMETIRRLAPTPFPPGVRPRTLRVHLPVVFELQ